MKYIFAAVIIALVLPTYTLADDMIGRLNPSEGANLNLDDLQWFPDPSLPEGSQIALVAGNPGAAEVFMVYVKIPPDSVIAPHTHPYAEVVTILKGSVWNAHGKKVDKTKGKILTAGSSLILPAGHPHYMWNNEGVIALLTATGPWNINYINPEDDPRNSKK